MNPCTCDNEAKDLHDKEVKLDKAIAEYVHALIVQTWYEAILEVLKSRWVKALCHLVNAASDSLAKKRVIVGPVIAGKAYCKLLARAIPVFEYLLRRQKAIVNAKEMLYFQALAELITSRITYLICKNSLKLCAGCGEEVKPECIKTCRGCGRDYCNTCFDAGIEAWEIKQKEK